MINFRNILKAIALLPLAMAFSACGGDDNDEPQTGDSRFGQQNAIFSITVSPDLLLAADIYCEYNDFAGNTITEQITTETRDLIISSSEPVFQSDVTAQLTCRRKNNFVPDASKDLIFNWSMTAIGSIVSKDGTPWAECMPLSKEFNQIVKPEKLDEFFTTHSADIATLTLSFRRSGNNYSVTVR